MHQVLRTVLAGTTLLLIPCAQAFAGPHLKLPWHQQVNPHQCDKVGKVIINVQQVIFNDVDSGEAGNYWAFDTFHRHIQVWKQSDGTYCALVSYHGKFDAQAGQKSPGDTDFLTGSEDGNFQGGYRGVITGTLLATPLWKTKGNVGTFDYGCDILGVCPGYISWIDQYFSEGSGFEYGWWGWIYRAPHGKVWVNSSDGNEGDVF